jgi:hypothetical protein
VVFRRTSELSGAGGVEITAVLVGANQIAVQRTQNVGLEDKRTEEKE